MTRARPRTLEQRMAALRADPTPEAIREALRSPVGVLVASAAKHATEQLAGELVPAFERLRDIKRDPGCRGKVAIARALHELERWEDDVFVVGVQLVQSEPAFGGAVDTAAELRGVCGLAYAHFGRSDALDVLAELLADRERPARIAAARGLGDAGRPDASALLRYKLLVGDEEPEVLSGCFESLLYLGDAIEFAVRMLDRHDDRAEAAALALGARRDQRAIEPLIAWCAACGAAQRGRVGYLALALLRLEPATAHLLEVVRTGAVADARAAGKAVATFKDDPSLAERLRAAAARRDRAFRAEIDAALA